jgi:hypothetical protein
MLTYIIKLNILTGEMHFIRKFGDKLKEVMARAMNKPQKQSQTANYENFKNQFQSMKQFNFNIQ